MNWISFSRKRKAVVSSVVLACVALFSGRKMSEYSSPPAREKTCDFLFPADDRGNKPTHLIIQPPRSPITLARRDGFINDASCLNKTPVYGVVQVKSID